jgi:uncharacterized protein YcbK (DUF882 family)
VRNSKLLAMVLGLVSLGFATPTHAGSTAVASDAVHVPTSLFPELPSPAPTGLDAVRQFVTGALLPAAPHTVTVELYDVNANRSAVFQIPLDGQLPREQAIEVGRFFGCHRTGRSKPIHPGTLAMLAEVAQRYPGHVIELVSGYRASPEERRTSPHRGARAIDFRVRGVKTTEIRDWLWSTHEKVGIGWYPHSNFLHMDVRPDKKDTAWTQHRKNEDNDYHPRWARLARRAAR